MTSATARPASPAASLRGNKDFLYLWVGAGVSFLGSRISAYAYPLIVLWTTGSATTAGVVAFVTQLPFVVAQLPAGIIADRLDRRSLMILCDVGRAVVVGTIPVVWWLGGATPVYLAVAGFVEGTLTVVYRIVERAALPSVVPPELLTAATGRNEARERAAGLLGQPGAGVFAALAHWVPFLFTAVAHLISFGMLLMIKTKLQAERSPDAAPRRALADLREAVVWMWGQKFARAAVGLIAVSNLLFQVLLLVVLVVVRDGGGSTSAAAIVTGLSGVGGVLGALCGPWCAERLKLSTLVIGANLTWALLVPLVAVIEPPVALGLLFGLTGFVGAIWTVAVSAHLIKIVPSTMRGRITSIAILMAYGPLAFGSLLGGLAVDRLGVAATAFASAGVMALLTVLAAISPAIRTIAGPRATEIDADNGSTPSVQAPH